jgi:ABC-type transport system substrate-binding protein
VKGRVPLGVPALAPNGAMPYHPTTSTDRAAVSRSSAAVAVARVGAARRSAMGSRGSELAVFVRVLVAAFVAVAAAQPYVYPDEWTDLPAADARYGGVLVTTTGGDPRTFNPLVSVESNIVVAHMTSPYMGVPTLAWRRPLDGAWEPYGAASLTFSDDGLQIDAELREGLRWSDGSPITIQDYLLSYALQTHPVAGRYVLDSTGSWTESRSCSKRPGSARCA